MFKKIILILILGLVIFIGISYYNSRKTVECWWGVVYPSLSFIAIEDEDEDETKISALDTNYYYINKEEEPIKIKIAILEWFKKHF